MEPAEFKYFHYSMYIHLPVGECASFLVAYW
jgi:hypothetical protein